MASFLLYSIPHKIQRINNKQFLLQIVIWELLKLPKVFTQTYLSDNVLLYSKKTEICVQRFTSKKCREKHKYSQQKKGKKNTNS